MTIRPIVFAAMLLAGAPAQALPPVYTVQTGVGSDDVGGDAETFGYLTGAVLFSNGLSANSIIDLQGEISTIGFPDNDDRSGEEIFLQGTYSYTPRAGFRVPTYSAGLRHVEEFFQDDELDASTTSLILSLSYRLDDRNSLLGGLKLDSRDSSDDSDTTGYFVSYDYRYSPRVILYSTLNLADEDIEAGGAVSGLPDTAARRFVGSGHLPSERGGAGSGSPSTSDNTYLTLGASWALTTSDSLDLSVSREEYDTDAGEVSGNIYSVDFFHRF